MKHLSVSAAALVATLVLPSFAADIAGGGSKTGELKPFNRAPVHPPKNTPDAATKNLAKAKIPQGFTADIWASEPLLANPVAFCFDNEGRMFVSETHRYRSSVLDIRHYMFMLEDDLASRNQDDWMASIKKNFPKDWQDLAKESEVIRLVQDSNGDGKADQSSVYADGFNSHLDGIASGVLWDNGSLYFANIPALTKLSGKDKGEKREELHRGYGVRFSYTGHDFHGLAKGPDGRIYFSIGDRGASVKTKEGGSIEIPDEGGVFRCEPDGSHLELVMRGLRNPQELAFDDYGNLFTGDNDSDQGDRERWVNVVEGADAGWRIGWQHHPLGKEFNPWLAEKMWEPRDPKKGQPYYIMPPIANLPDGPSGLVYYPGTGMPAEFAGSFYLAGYKGSTAKSAVSTFKSPADGAGFKLEGLRTFMDNVQATDVDFGPDSRFYVSAWDEGWERSDQGRIYRLTNTEAYKAQAAQVAEVQKILGEGFEKKTPTELLKMLAHADQRVRLGAQWALTDKLVKNPNAVDSQAAAQIMKNGVEGPRKDLSRLHLLWAGTNAARITALRKNEPAKTVNIGGDTAAFLEDSDAAVRGQIISSLAQTGDRWSPKLMKQVASKLKDPAPRVRFFAAMALSKKGDASSAPDIVNMLRENDGKDNWLQHAGVMALAGTKNEAELAKAAKDESRAIRLAALLAYRKLGSEKVADFLADKDPELVAEAATAINDAPIAAAMPALAKLLTPSIDTKDSMTVVRILNANFRVGDAASAGRLAQFAAESKHDSLRGVALEMLAHWGNPPARDYVVGIYRPLPKRDAAPAAQAVAQVAEALLSQKSEKLAIAACEAIESNSVKAASPQLLALVKNAQAPVKARMAALDALSALGTPDLRPALEAAAADANGALKTEASKLLSKSDPATAAKELAASFAKADVAQKKQVLVALGDNSSPEAGKAIAGILADAAKVPAAARLELLEAAAKRPDLKDSAAKAEAALFGNDALSKYAVALEGGDVVAGERLFKEHAVAACLRCHKVSGQGGDAGPALDGIAAKKDRRYLLESIVNVNAAIAEGFQMVVLTMKDGSTQAGFLKKETDADLTIQTPGEAATKTFKKAEVKQRETAPSGMLPNIAELITRRELRDIIEYVATLK